MTYNKQTWVDGDKTRPLSAARLAHMETQYDAAMADVAAAVGDPESPIGAELNTTIGDAIDNIVQPRYADIPYEPDSAILPVATNAKAFALWGSSTPEGLAPYLSPYLIAEGATLYGAGVSGERWEHTAARIGSDPAQLTFPGNTVPASGSVAVTASIAPSFSSIHGFVVTEAGERIGGTLTHPGGVVTFTRSSAGSAAPIIAGATFHPSQGRAHRNDVFIINAGKNNLTGGGDPDPVKVAQATLRMRDYQAALGKRVLVLGQFANTGTGVGSPTRARILEADGILKDALGPTFLDTTAWVTGPEYWADTGLAPTSQDLAEQALGNKPESGSLNEGHFDASGYAGYVKRIMRQLAMLGWSDYEPYPAITSDAFTGGDVADIVGRNSDASLGGDPAEWEGTATSLAITGGSLVPASSPAASYFCGFEVTEADVSLEFVMDEQVSGGGFWVDIRRAAVSGTPNSYRLAFHQSRAEFYVQKRVSNSITTLSGVLPYAPGDKFEIRAIGQVVTALHNDVIVFQGLDSDVSSPGYAGIAGLTATQFSIPQVRVLSPVVG